MASVTRPLLYTEQFACSNYGQFGLKLIVVLIANSDIIQFKIEFRSFYRVFVKKVTLAHESKLKPFPEAWR